MPKISGNFNLVFVILLLIICLQSCANETDNSSWSIYTYYDLPKNFTPVGIANFRNYLIVSDSSKNRVVMIDWVRNKIEYDLEVKKPVYVNVRNSRMLIPSFTDDSIYVFRGSYLYSMHSFDPLNQPTGIEAFAKENYFMVDQGNHRVLYKYGHEFDLVVGGKGKAEGQFNYPSNILFWGIHFYVVDSGNKRVQVFSELGDFLFSFGEKEELIWPTGITHNDDNIFISDMPSRRILVYDKKGNLVETIRKEKFQPSDISFFEKRLYIADQRKNRVMVLHQEQAKE